MRGGPTSLGKSLNSVKSVDVGIGQYSPQTRTTPTESDGKSIIPLHPKY